MTIYEEDDWYEWVEDQELAANAAEWDEYLSTGIDPTGGQLGPDFDPKTGEEFIDTEEGEGAFVPFVYTEPEIRTSAPRRKYRKRLKPRKWKNYPTRFLIQAADVETFLLATNDFWQLRYTESGKNCVMDANSERCLASWIYGGHPEKVYTWYSQFIKDAPSKDDIRHFISAFKHHHPTTPLEHYSVSDVPCYGDETDGLEVFCPWYYIKIKPEQERKLLDMIPASGEIPVVQMRSWLSSYARSKWHNKPDEMWDSYYKGPDDIQCLLENFLDSHGIQYKDVAKPVKEKPVKKDKHVISAPAASPVRTASSSKKESPKGPSVWPFVIVAVLIVAGLIGSSRYEDYLQRKSARIRQEQLDRELQKEQERLRWQAQQEANKQKSSPATPVPAQGTPSPSEGTQQQISAPVKSAPQAQSNLPKRGTPYGDGYWAGYEEGYDDADGYNQYGYKYDERTNKYSGRDLSEYIRGYRKGYRDGWDEGQEDLEDRFNMGDEELDEGDW